MTLFQTGWRSIACGGLALVAFSCSRTDSSARLTLKIQAPARGLPFTCYALHVAGPGITSAENPPEGNPCVEPGLGTSYLSTTEGPVELSLEVPPGPARLIQVVGVQGPECPATLSLVETLRAYDGGGSLPEGVTGLFEVGRVEAEISGPTTLELEVAHDSNAPLGMTFCENGAPVAQLKLVPSFVSLGVNQSQVYGGSGGFAPYQLKDAVGGSLAGNIFTTGSSEEDTSLTLRDSRGNETTVIGRSFDGSTADIWLTADSLSTANDGDAIAAWYNSGNDSVLEKVTTVGSGVFYRATKGPNSLPILEFNGAGGFAEPAPDFDGGTPSSARVLMVARRAASNSGTLLCASSGGECTNNDDQIHLRSPDPGQSILTFGKYPTHLQNPGPLTDGTDFRLHRVRLDSTLVSYAQDDTFTFSIPFTPAFGTLAFESGTATLHVGTNNGDSYFEGDIAEIVVYFSDPGDTRLTQTIRYLKLKYGVD